MSLDYHDLSEAFLKNYVEAEIQSDTESLTIHERYEWSEADRAKLFQEEWED